MPHVTTDDGIRIGYSLYGEPDRPALVFSHALGVDSRLWEPQIPLFSKRYRIVAVDTRGHGQSDAPPGPYTIERLGRDVIVVMDRLDIESAFFCGLSMGGMVGMWLGRWAPERFAALALCNTAAFMEGFGGDGRIETARTRGMEPLVQPTVERWMTAAFRAENPQTVAAVADWIRACNPEGYAACCEAIRAMDQREQLSQITVPALNIVGEHDAATPPGMRSYIADRIPGGEVQMIEGVAHVSNIEKPDIFNRAIGAFFAAHGGSA